MHCRELNLGSIIVLMIVLAPLPSLHAQNDCGDECKVNTNLGIVVNFPVGETGQVAKTGWGALGGVGYNFNKRHALIGEFMWNKVYALNEALAPLQATLPSGTLFGSTDLFTLSGNYRFELRGRLLGTYLIGGSGWYYRNASLSKAITSGTGTSCTPGWLWWGFTCTSGTVNANQTLTVSSSSTWGANGGAGFTVRVGGAPYRLYTEARYHYAPTKGINTQFVLVTFGIRY
jgi:Outer membrane protein beta-barrel domain